MQQYLPFTVLKRIPYYIPCVLLLGLQQYLPFTVLKPNLPSFSAIFGWLQQYLPFTVLKPDVFVFCKTSNYVATVLTVYGIETNVNFVILNKFYAKLQQYLPFTVLKRICFSDIECTQPLQQYLPFTVLKPTVTLMFVPGRRFVATVLTVYGIETLQGTPSLRRIQYHRCNSTYRLRY